MAKSAQEIKDAKSAKEAKAKLLANKPEVEIGEGSEGTIQEKVNKLPDSIMQLRPVTLTYLGFQYKGFESMKDLIAFLGGNPVINQDLTLSFKKNVIKENDFIIKLGEKIVKVASSLEGFEVKELTVQNKED